MRLRIGTFIGIALLAWATWHSGPERWSVAHAQAPAQTPEQIAEIAAANLRKSELPPTFELDRIVAEATAPEQLGSGDRVGCRRRLAAITSGSSIK